MPKPAPKRTARSRGAFPRAYAQEGDQGIRQQQSFQSGRTATTIGGALRSTRNATFTVQFFSNPKNTRDEGKKLVGQKTVADGDGVVTFSFKPERKVEAGTFVTATATNVATGDTSEFSAPRKVRG